ncbi:MAG: hypothetical protein LBS91_02360 [Clostridiales Family XIII bacterium]|nr:hypothetical protein [Clostridiales Family XIII bacterium]
MDISQIADMAKSAAGIIETAVITVYDTTDSVGARQTVPGGQVGGLAASALAAGPASAAGDAAAVLRTYKVQFNPSELAINAARQMESKAGAEAGEGTTRNAVQTAFVTSSQRPDLRLTVKLIFDEVNLTDAFAQEKFNMPGTMSSMKNLASMALNKAKPPTVQPIVEGFIGAMRNPKTRKVGFNWGTFRFTGYIESLVADYVMFSVSGRPIRATVTMRLKSTIDDDMAAVWEAAIAEAFGGGSSSLSGVKNSVGNLLNFGW